MEENRRQDGGEQNQEEFAKLILTENGESLNESEPFGKIEKWRLKTELRRTKEKEEWFKNKEKKKRRV